MEPPNTFQLPEHSSEGPSLASLPPFPLDSNQFSGPDGISLALIQLQNQLQQLQHQPNPPPSTLGPARRRVWIKREGSVPTTVYVDANDLIGKYTSRITRPLELNNILDDLKSLVIQKYPNSLGKQVDPVDIHIRAFSKTYENARTASNSRASSRDASISRNGTVLSPEESVFDVLGRLFPNGTMTSSDAFLITIASQSFTNQPLHLQSLQSQNEAPPHPLHPSRNQGSVTNLFMPAQSSSDDLPIGSPTVPSFNRHETSNSQGSNFPTAQQFVKSTSHASRDTENLSSNSEYIGHPSNRNSIDLSQESSPTFPVKPTNQSFSGVGSNSTIPMDPVPAVSAASHISVSSSEARTSPNHSNPNSNRATSVERIKSQSGKKTGNGVILLPRQFKNSNTSFGQKKNTSKLPIDTNMTALSNPGNFQSSPTNPHSPGMPHTVNEIHHTKSGAYQRVRPISNSPTISTAQGDVPELPSQRTILQPKSEGILVAQEAAASGEGPASGSSSKPLKLHTDGLKRKKSRPQLMSPNKARPPAKAVVAPLHVRHALESGDRHSNSGSPLEDSTANSVSNNRKLLLSINKGISPYTTVVPQVNVLIVEDNVINQKILETYLRKRKIRSSTAKNGKEAIEKWRQGGFHLVLMDIQLPVMNGIEATKKIRRMEHQNRIGVFSSATFDGAKELPASAADMEPEDVLDAKKFRSPIIIVALTASSSLADKSEALAAGCNDFLTKPVNLKWLEQKTIEWGCMQALIDFEGWKHWVSSKESILQSPGVVSKPGLSLPMPPNMQIPTLSVTPSNNTAAAARRAAASVVQNPEGRRSRSNSSTSQSRPDSNNLLTRSGSGKHTQAFSSSSSLAS